MALNAGKAQHGDVCLGRVSSIASLLLLLQSCTSGAEQTTIREGSLRKASRDSKSTRQRGVIHMVKFSYLLTALHADASWLGCALILRKSSDGIWKQSIHPVGHVTLCSSASSTVREYWDHQCLLLVSHIFHQSSQPFCPPLAPQCSQRARVVEEARSETKMQET